MKRASHISNADIAWFVVNYTGPLGELAVSDVVLTTLLANRCESKLHHESVG